MLLEVIVAVAAVVAKVVESTFLIKVSMMSPTRAIGKPNAIAQPMNREIERV